MYKRGLNIRSNDNMHGAYFIVIILAAVIPITQCACCVDWPGRIIGTAIVDVYDSDSSDSSSSSSSEIDEETSESKVIQDEIAQRNNLISELKTLAVWGTLNEGQQKRLTNAILNDLPVPDSWTQTQDIRSYSDLLDLKNTEFLRQPSAIESLPVFL